MKPTDLLKRVKALAKRGLKQQQIAKELGFKSTTTLTAHLVKASQTTKKPVPVFGQRRGGQVTAKRVATVQIKQRGKGNSFGVNVPMDPLVRAGFKVGKKLTVKATKGRIVLSG